MFDTVIHVENLGKKYSICHQQPERYTTLRDAIAIKTKSFFKTIAAPSLPDKLHPTSEDFWALKDVSFEVKQGDRIGIIGRNGAGKSTLLKILSRITEPTSGRIRIHGRIASLLEVGTGFHPELTGRENIFLNGAILGMSKAEIQRKFDAIVAFAEVERFLDTPVKRYSSGMYVRLAFAVAAHLEPEILLVDEVLAVGDVSFQKKCLGKMKDIATSEGRTIIFVSHNMEAIQKLCQRCVYLQHGTVNAIGETNQVIPSYLTHLRSRLESQYTANADSSIEQKAYLSKAVILNSQQTISEAVLFGEPFSIQMTWKYLTAIRDAAFAVRIYDQQERFITATNTLDTPLGIEAEGIHQVVCSFPSNCLAPGIYRLSIGCYVRPHTVVEAIDECLKLVILDSPYNPEFSFNIIGNPAVALPSLWNHFN